jgi:hypothetical protein
MGIWNSGREQTRDKQAGTVHIPATTTTEAGNAQQHAGGVVSLSLSLCGSVMAAGAGSKGRNSSRATEQSYKSTAHCCYTDFVGH